MVIVIVVKRFFFSLFLSGKSISGGFELTNLVDGPHPASQSSPARPADNLVINTPSYSAINLKTLIMAGPDADFDLSKVSSSTSLFATSNYFPKLCC